MLTHPVTLAFLSIMLLATGLGIILAHNAKKRARAAFLKRNSKKNPPAQGLEEDLQKFFKNSPRQYDTVKRKITETIEKEVEKKLEIKTSEISQQFKQVIEEKDKNINFVEEQFQNVSEQYTKLNTTFKDLGAQKKQTEEVVRNMAEGVVMVNKKGEVIMMNPAAEKMLGAQKDGKMGKPVLSDLSQDHLITMAQESGDSKEKEIVVQSQNNETQKILRASNAVIESEDGKTVGFVSVLSDVTKQRELDTLKQSFLDNISHDLRTPLTCVQGSLAVLCEDPNHPLTAAQAKLANIALNNIKRLSRLINDLLDLSKLEAKKFSVEPAPFLIGNLLDSLSAEFGSWSQSKGVTIETNVEENIELVADQDRISQVITNLTGNALKFTPEDGKVTLEVKRSSEHRVEIAVRDTGPGISKKDQQKLFEKFAQLDTPNLQGVSGTGLGLTICKEIVELHHGKIWIESQEGKGSRFVFEIPIKYVAPASALPDLPE